MTMNNYRKLSLLRLFCPLCFTAQGWRTLCTT